MKIAVAQHRLRSDPAQDIDALARMAREASVKGAELLVLPEVASLEDESVRDDMFRRIQPVAPRMWLMPHVRDTSAGHAFRPTTLPGAEELGRVAMPVGDAAMDPGEISRLYEERPDVLVLAPLSRSELQAEAVLELAIGLSESVSGLVVVAEATGADAGEPGHGGSAIVLFGEVVSEAVGDDDLLIADVPIPVPAVEPREPVPQVPPILLQRLARHRGEKLEVDYPADLS